MLIGLLHTLEHLKSRGIKTPTCKQVEVLPAVRQVWVLACHRDKTWVTEQQLLVGEHKIMTPG